MACVSMAAVSSTSSLRPAVSPPSASLDVPVTQVAFPSKNASLSSVRITGSLVSVPCFRPNTGKVSWKSNGQQSKAASDDTTAGDYADEIAPADVEDDPEEETAEPIALLPETTEASRESDDAEDPNVSSLKQALVDSLYGTERGFRASSETRAEVSELIAQLEAVNPNPSTTEAASTLNGKWILAYTSFSELYPLLAAGSLPFVTVGDIEQTINTTAGLLSNRVTFSGPIASISFTTEASFEVRSPKRIQVKFEEGVISSPEMIESVEVPKSVDLFGRTVDVSQFESVLKPLQEAAAAIIRTISGQPPLKFPITGGQAQSWLLTTYLDKDLRVSRGDGGGVFVLIKEGSFLC